MKFPVQVVIQENQKAVIFHIIISDPISTLLHRFLCSSNSNGSSPRQKWHLHQVFPLLSMFSYFSALYLFISCTWKKVGVIFSFGPMNSSPNDTSFPCKITVEGKFVGLRPAECVCNLSIKVKGVIFFFLFLKKKKNYAQVEQCAYNMVHLTSSFVHTSVWTKLCKDNWMLFFRCSYFDFKNLSISIQVFTFFFG